MSLLGERCWYLPRWLSWLPGHRLPAPSPVGVPASEGIRVG
jgi:hypothetical protein